MRKVAPGFLFVAEAYWGTDWHLQQVGFDFTYDNEFYERLSRRDIAGVKAHLTSRVGIRAQNLLFLFHGKSLMGRARTAAFG